MCQVLFFIVYVTNAVFKLKSRHHSIYFLHIAKTLVYTCALYHPHTNAEIKIRSVTRLQINIDNHIHRQLTRELLATRSGSTYPARQSTHLAITITRHHSRFLPPSIRAKQKPRIANHARDLLPPLLRYKITLDTSAPTTFSNKLPKCSVGIYTQKRL